MVARRLHADGGSDHVFPKRGLSATSASRGGFLEFRILGPVRALDDDGQVLPLGGAKQRATLAVLLLRRNEVVARDDLIDGLWGGSPPPTAVATVKTYISRLRSVLPDDCEGGRLVSRASGYVLHVKTGELDLERFESLSDAARASLASGDVWAATQALTRALALFRGSPLQDLPFAPFAQGEIRRLEEMRLATLRLRFDVDLAAGRHTEVVGELEALVAQYPFREDLWGQLMLALYRSGRQGDALIAFDQARHILADELGVDPGRSLQTLHRRILDQDPSLELVMARPGDSGGPPGADEVTANADAASGQTMTSPSAPIAIPGGGEPFSDRRPHARRRRVRRRVGTGVAAMAVVGIAVVLATVALPRTSRESDTGAGASYRPGTSLIDLATGRLIRTITQDELYISAYPISAGGKFWVNNWSPSEYVQIDPNSGAMTKHINLPPRDPTVTKDYTTIMPWAVDGNSVWVTAGDDLVRLDATLGREADRIPLDELGLGTGLAEGVAVGDGSVWVSRDVDRGQILRLSADGHIRRAWNNITPYLNLAYGDGSLWVADEDGLARIDPETDRVIRAGGIQGNCGGGYGGCVAAGGGFGWTSDPAKGLVYKVDPDGHIVATYSTGVGTSFLSYADASLWVANADAGTVTRIDAATGEMMSAFTFGHPVSTMVAEGGVLLVDLGPGVAPIEGYIDGLPGNVARFFAYPGELGDEEPALNTGPGAYQIESATCVKLLNYPDAPPPAGLRLRPEVAATMPTVSADGRTYTFTVRLGYRFSPPSNEPVTAETFRYSIERALSLELAKGPTVPAPPGPQYIDDIVGERAFLDGAAKHISGLKTNENELTITLTKPSADFLERLALPYFCPLPTGTPFIAGAPHQIGANGEGFIVSAGPYYVADYNDGYVILKRNPSYIGPRTPAFDAIAIREGADLSHALDRIQNSGWDGITSLPDAALDPGGPIDQRWGSGSSARPGDQRYFLTPEMATRFIAFNSTNGIFADPVVRRAAALALNRVALAAAWGAIPSDQPLSPAFRGYQDRNLYRLSPSSTTAKELMGGRSGEAVMPIPSQCAPCAESARIVQRDLGAIGIDVSVREVGSLGAALRSRSRFDLLDLRSDLPYPDPASFLGQILEDVPAEWIPPKVSASVSDVMALNGGRRFAAAASLADRLDHSTVLFTAYGTPETPQFLTPSIGCRVFTPVGNGVDLTHLCPADR
jgi:DNA-binding SARP family transcriptional activator/ABC-type oligopeptide transport system substrate-binding subunit